MAFHSHVDVEFLDIRLNFRERITSLARRIEEFRAEAAHTSRNLSGQEAALEGIDRHGGEFFRAG